MDEAATALDTYEFDGSRILFARPSAIEGAARVLDIAGTISEYNRAGSEQEADFYALLSDWCTVGQDIRQAMHRFDSEHKKPSR